MTTLVQAVEAARDQFLFYAKEHRAKTTATRVIPMTQTEMDTTLEKALVNERLAVHMQQALDERHGEGGVTQVDMLTLEKVQDYRFGQLTKGEHYSFARGLTINPTHLPAALDAMLKDGFKLVCMFGEAVSDKMGLVFEHVGPNRRVQELLEANTKLVLEKREIKEKYDELKFRMDGLEK